MSSDHNRLDALRRLAKDRAATPAEKASARRFAKALAAKIGKHPRRSRRKGPDAALPEPPAARWRRQWVIWIEAALHNVWLAWKWVYWIWIVTFVGLLLIIFFGSEAVRRQVVEVYLWQTIGVVAAAFALIAIGGLLAFVAWWLRTWRNERLRPALVFLSGHVSWLAGLGTYICLVVYLEDRFT